MKSATIEHIGGPPASDSTRRIRLSREDRVTPGRTHWGALYAIFLVGVGLCVVGSRIASAFGHPALLQFGVVLAMLGLLVAWVRSNRASLSAEKPGTSSPAEPPFSVIHVAFSPKAVGSGCRAFTTPPDAAHCATAVQPAASASQR